MEDQSSLLKNTYEIKFDEAVRLIHNFLQEPELLKIAQRVAVGGVMHKESLNQKNTGLVFQGQMAWFCMPQDPNSTYPKFFLAFEDGDYEIANVPEKPKNDELVFTRHIIKYGQSGTNKSDVETFIKSGFTTPTNRDETVSAVDCKNMFSHVGTDTSGSYFNKYYCGFFENRGRCGTEYTDFISNENAKFIAYLFGYDDSTEEYKETNRIRIILMALDGNGQLVQEASGLTSAPRILQASWPPPPNN